MIDNKIIVGNEEWCRLPGLSIPAVKARIDSGAKTSSLHALNIETFQRRGRTWVRFDVHPLKKNRKTLVHCEAPLHDQRAIKSSNGHSEKRYVIKTILVLGNHSWNIELTLTNRDAMGYRMLLGREAMAGKIVIDPDKSHLFDEPDNAELKRLYHPTKQGKSGLRIGLLVSSPKAYTNRRLMEAGELLGHDMQLINLKQCASHLDMSRPHVRYDKADILDNFDVIIPRANTHQTPFLCALLRQFTRLGSLCANSPDALQRSQNPFTSLEHLFAQGIDLPPTCFTQGHLSTATLEELLGSPPFIIHTPDNPGNAPLLASDLQALDNLLSSLRSTKAPLLIQKYMSESEGKIQHYLVVANKVLGATQEAGSSDPQTNHLFTAQSTPPKDETRLAVQATKKLGLTFAGVQLLRSHSGPLLLSVTPNPKLELFEGPAAEDLASAVLKQLEKKTRAKRI